MPLIFSGADLEAMRKVKKAFDPEDILNPGKILPDALGASRNR
jgi:FAD/FMN-containing dehydrogenase